jgi:hypothetical protein
VHTKCAVAIARFATGQRSDIRYAGNPVSPKGRLIFSGNACAQCGLHRFTDGL